MTPKAKKGMGFKAAAKSVAAKGGYSPDQAAAIVANASRNASPKAKKANPNLKKVTPAKKAQARTNKYSGGK